MNFDEAQREITITHTLYRGKPKEPKTKTSKGKLRVHPYIVSLLRSHHQRSGFQGENDFIFCRADGSPWNAEVARDHLQKAIDATGIHRVKSHHGFHIFRHTAATLLYEQSQNITHVQSVLRHADSGITSRYAHVDKKAVEGAEMLTEVILGDSQANCDLFVTQTSEMIS